MSSTLNPTLSPMMRTAVVRPAARRREPAYRLTRRGRLVVFLVAIGVVVAAFVMLAGGSVATSDDGADTTTVVVVQPGESLWTIASRAGGSDDVRATMRRIEDLNALVGTGLQAGQRLLVPTE